VRALLIAGLAALAWTAAVHARIDWNLPAPLVPFRGGSGPSPATRRALLIVLVDGLRADEAQRLPALQRLAAGGASADLLIEGPTFSSAQYVALLTGVPPMDSGIRNNSALRPVGLDSLPAQLRAQGRFAVAASDEVDWWKRLFGDAWGEMAVMAPTALPAWVRGHDWADLVLAHLCRVDSAGHSFGASSAEYHRAADGAGDEVDELVKGWLRPGRAVAVLEDHGHLGHGGHGGDEPEVRRTWMVLAGDGVRRGASAEGSALNVAPTLAALAGAPVPRSAEGRALTELLDLPPAERERIDISEQDRIREVAAAAQTARAEAIRAEERARVIRGAAVLPLLALVGLLLLRGGPATRRGARVGLGVLGASVLGHAVLWGRLSASEARLIGDAVLNIGGLSLGLSLLAVVLYGREPLREHPQGAARFSTGFAIGVSPLAIAAFVEAGAFVPRFTCLPAWREMAPMAIYAAFGAALVAALVPMGVAAALHGRRHAGAG
jgi:hypothetical protein